MLDAHPHRDADRSEAWVPVAESDERTGTRSTVIHIAVFAHEVRPVAQHPSAPAAGALHLELEDFLGDVTHAGILEQAFGFEEWGMNGHDRRR